MDAVYYSKGSRFGEARVLAFARTLAKDHHTVTQVVDQAVATMREHALKLVVDSPSRWTCGANTRGQALSVSHDPAGNSETLVFLEEGEAVVVLGLIANDDPHRATALPKLRELCNSYKFVGPVTH